MKRLLAVLLIACSVALLCSCSGGDDYTTGSGTASRADISYAPYDGPESQGGMKVNSGTFFVSGDFHYVSKGPASDVTSQQ